MDAVRRRRREAAKRRAISKAASLAEEAELQFNARQFALQWLYHLTFPFSIPLLVWPIEGWNANYVLTFIPLHPRHIATSTFMPSCFMVGLALYLYAVQTGTGTEDATFMPDWVLRVHIGYHFARCAVIALKYAFLPPRQYRLMMRAPYAASWRYNNKIMLVAAWLFPAEDVIRREALFSSARRLLQPTQHEVAVHPAMQGYMYAMLRALLPKPDPTAEDAHEALEAGSGAATTPTAGGGTMSPLDMPTLAPVADVLPEAATAAAPPAHAELAPWERSLLRTGRLNLLDLAVAVQTACCQDPWLRVQAFLPKMFGIALVVLSAPYVTFAVRGVIGAPVTALTAATHVAFFFSSFFNVGSMMVFYGVAVVDYARRAAAQRLLTALVRPLPAELKRRNVNVLYPFAGLRWAARDGGGVDDGDGAEAEEEMEALTNMQSKSDGGALEVVAEDDEEEESDSEEEGRGGNTVVAMAPTGGSATVVPVAPVTLQDGSDTDTSGVGQGPGRAASPEGRATSPTPRRPRLPSDGLPAHWAADSRRLMKSARNLDVGGSTAPAPAPRSTGGGGAPPAPHVHTHAHGHGMSEAAAAADQSLISALVSRLRKGDSAVHTHPLVDPAEPSNAFAWMRLKELMTDLGLRFQTRMQVYVALTAVLILFLDAAAVSRVLQDGRGWGSDVDTDFLILASITHSVLVFVIVLTCISLAAVANSSVQTQTQALSHSLVELEVLADRIQCAVDDKNEAAAPLRQRRPSSARSAARSVASGTTAATYTDELDGDLAPLTTPQLLALHASVRTAVDSLQSALEGLVIRNTASPVRVMGIPGSFTLVRILFTGALTLAAAVIGLR